MTNRETQNDRFKLAHHRLVARALKANPRLLDEARAVVAHWKRQPIRASYVDEWAALLDGPVERVRRDIVRRTPESNRLRRSSPFALTATQVLAAEGAVRLRKRLSRPVLIAR